MRLHFFAVPVLDGEQAAAELNRFLGAHRVVSVDKELVHAGGASAWAVCVTVAEAGPSEAQARPQPRVDYKEVLTPEQFALFSRLRTVRKELAEAEGVPVFAVFTNEQLAAFVTRGASSRADLGRVEGVGEARLQKYADAVLAVLAPGAPA